MKNDLNELKRVTSELMNGKLSDPLAIEEDFFIPTSENTKAVNTVSKEIKIRTLQEQENYSYNNP